MTKRKTERVCINCGALVKPIDGKVLLKGNAANWRHVDRPEGCVIGDPLMDRQVRKE